MFLPKKIITFYLQSGTNLHTNLFQFWLELSTVNIWTYSEPSAAEVNFENLKTDVEKPLSVGSIKPEEDGTAKRVSFCNQTCVVRLAEPTESKGGSSFREGRKNLETFVWTAVSPTHELTRTHACRHTRTHIVTGTRKHTHTRVRLAEHTLAHNHARTQTYTETHIHTHLHMRMTHSPLQTIHSRALFSLAVSRAEHKQCVALCAVVDMGGQHARKTRWKFDVSAHYAFGVQSVWWNVPIDRHV